jgi:hypothetical protein
MVARLIISRSKLPILKKNELLSFEDALYRDLDHLSLCHQQTYVSCSTGVMRVIDSSVIRYQKL